MIASWQCTCLGEKPACYTDFSMYAPTMTNPDDVKDKFYQELDSLISDIPEVGKTHHTWWLQCQSWSKYQTWEGAIGRNRVGKCNSNGLLLLRTCVMHDLLITSTVFRQPNQNKTTWMHLRLKHWHFIDYINKISDQQDVLITKVVHGTECWTDQTGHLLAKPPRST